MAGGLLFAARACAIALVFTPLVINSLAQDDSYMSPKWMWIATWSFIGLGALLGRALVGKTIRFPFRPLAVMIPIFLLYQALSLIWARSFSLALEQVLNSLALTAAAWIALQTATAHRTLMRFAWLWIAVAVVTAFWTIQQDFTYAFAPEKVRLISNLPDWRGYLAAGLGNTNHIGDFLALALLPTLVILGEARRKHAVVSAIFAAVLLAAGLTVCYSVGSNLGLIVGAAAMMVLVMQREGLRFFRRHTRWIVLFALWGMILAFFIFDQPLNPHSPGLLKQGFGSERWQEGWPTRLVIWANGLEIVRQHPILGVGAGNFTYVFPEMKSVLIQDRPDLLLYQGRWTNAAHNVLLQAWAELGIGGLFIFLATVVLAYHSLLTNIRWCARSEFVFRLALVGLLTAWLAQGMMNFSLQQPTGALTFYFILVGIIIEAESRKGTPKMPPFVLDLGWLRIRIDWREMRRPLWAGVSFHLTEKGTRGTAFAALFAGLALVPLWRLPLKAQEYYRYARDEDRKESGSPKRKEMLMLRALRYNPWETGCRSHYSEWLVQHGRPQEALDQLAIVRKRLNSPELWERESRALSMLGRDEEAREAFEIFKERLWVAGQANKVSMGKQCGEQSQIANAKSENTATEFLEN